LFESCSNLGQTKRGEFIRGIKNVCRFSRAKGGEGIVKCQHGTSRLNYARGSRGLWPGKWIFQILKRFKSK
jgi:hypothetical protein